MNQTTSHLAKKFRGAVQNGNPFWVEVGGKKEISSKDWIIPGKVTFLWRGARVCQAHHLPSADQVITDDWLKNIPGRG